MTEEDDKMFILMWENGTPNNVIGNTFGVTAQTVRDIRNRLGCLPRSAPIKHVDLSLILERRKTETLEEIASELKVSRSYITKLLQRHAKDNPPPPCEPPPVNWKKVRDSFGPLPLEACIPYTMAILEKANHLNLD
jgi:AraC-like DNA-binding protein